MKDMKGHKKPLLITGCPRSGTTWVGKIIAQCDSTAYLHEPFNIAHSKKYPGKCATSFSFWYQYVSSENEEIAYKSISDAINYKYDLAAQIKSNENAFDMRRTFREYFQSFYYGFRKFRPVIKDPIAFFSSEWLASRFDMDVVILIRHPASVVSSFKLLQWETNFSNLLEQPLLMTKYFKNYENEILEFSHTSKPIIEQASLLWKLFCSATITLMDNNPNWTLVSI